MDWQLYYELAGLANSIGPPQLSSRQLELLNAYVNLKKPIVEAFITQVQSRINDLSDVEILPFHVVITDSGHHLFAGMFSVSETILVICFLFLDFIIRKISSVNPGKSSLIVVLSF